VTTAFLYYLALEHDDDFPDDVCPGCGQQVPRWREFAAHYPIDVRPTYLQEQRRLSDWYRGGVSRAGIPWPYINQVNVNGHRVACAWERDHFTARARARELIAEGITS
jgi:hypothetical protein